MLTQGPKHIDAETVKAHARVLKAILDEADLGSSKQFLRTFVKRIEIRGSDAVIRYTLPVPPSGELRTGCRFCLLKPQVELRGFEPLTSSLRTRRSPY